MSEGDDGEAFRADRWGKLEAGAEVLRAISLLAQLATAPSEIAARARFLDLLAPRPGERILDAGAGIGTIALDLARRIAPEASEAKGRVVALDPSADLLEIARRAAAGAGLGGVIEFESGDARALTHPDGSFDRALCHWVLLHVGPQRTIVKELRRVTRAGGKVLLVECDWETAIVHPGDRAVTRKILHASNDRYLDGWMGRRLASLLRSEGLRDVAIEPIVDAEIDPGPWLEFVRDRPEVAVQAGAVTPREAATWISSIEEAAHSGDYFFSVTQFAAIGTV